VVPLYKLIILRNILIYKQYTWVGNLYSGTVRPTGSQTRSNFKCTWRHKPCNRKPNWRSCRRDSCFMFFSYSRWRPFVFYFFSNASLSLTSISFHTSFLLSVLRVCQCIGWWLRKGVWIESHCLMKTNCYEDRRRIVFSYVTSLFGSIPRENKMLFEIFLPPPTPHLSVSAQWHFFLLLFL
jgi:hypothetical protein